MPEIHFVDERVTITVTFTDKDDLVVDPDTVTATLRDPEGTTSAPANDGSAGIYSFTKVVDKPGGWSWKFKGIKAVPLFDGVLEGTFQVEDSLVAPTLDFLKEADDLQGVRNVLGLTQWDVTDDMIREVEFSWQAEFRVKQDHTDWGTAAGDTIILLKLAAVYATAALISESYATGGTIGNTEGGDAGKERDWAKFAKQMWMRYQNNIDAANIAEDPDITYDLDSFVIASPRRAAGRSWSTAYPPIFDAPDLPLVS